MTRLLMMTACFALIGGTHARAADEMSVQVKTTQVRDKDSYLGKPLYELHFGDRVTILKKGATWFQVQPVIAVAKPAAGAVAAPPASPLAAGYLNKSALTNKRVVLKADQNAPIAASSEDVALAGKGFNDEVERAYQSEHPKLVAAYATLDQIETNSTYTPSAEDINAFRTAGGMNGGAK
jgi:hypothetical protein